MLYVYQKFWEARAHFSAIRFPRLRKRTNAELEKLFNFQPKKAQFNI